MDQNDVVNQLKSALNEFPEFLKNLIQRPMHFVDQDSMLTWPQILLFTFLVEAISNVIYNVMILNLSGIPSSLIYFPIQILVLVAFLSFILNFIFDKLGFTQVNFFQIFKLLCFAEMIVHLFVVPVLIVMVYLKSVEFIYAVETTVILAKAYLVYRGFSRQFHMANKRAFWIVSLFALVFISPTIKNFVSGYHTRKMAKEARIMHEQQMEKSIEEIERDLGHADTD